MSAAAYLRVSTSGQTVDQQRDAITAAGIDPDRVFTDTASGRAGADRPGWRDCLGWLRQGDTVVVVAIDRLGRSVRDDLVQSGLPVFSTELGDRVVPLFLVLVRA